MHNPLFITTFAGNMMNRIWIVVMLLCCAICTQAEIVLLRTGKEVEGTIVFQNEEVVILQTAGGGRFQFPRNDIQGIRAEQGTNTDVLSEPSASTDNSIGKKLSVVIEVVGGGGFIPKESAGGMFGANLLIGTHDLLKRRIFLGAGIGYVGEFIQQQKYSFLPLILAVRVPLLKQNKTPIIGTSLGYSFAMEKNYKGGLYADLQLGYCHHINEKYSWVISADFQIQQAKIPTTETIHHIPYEDTYVFTHTTGRCLLNTGVRVGLFF